jgi:hypothetical protein
MSNRWAIIPVIGLIMVVSVRWGKRSRAEGSPVEPHEALRFAFMIFAMLLPAFTLPEALKSAIIPPFDKVIITSITLTTAVAPLAVDWLIRSALRSVRRWEGRA